MTQPSTLTEKYRPRRLADIVGQDDAVSELFGYVQQRTVPHLLFGGPFGVGKTTAAHAFVREFHNGNSELAGVVKEVNASDDRDIEFVRKRVLEFLRTWSPAKPKFLILDEADNLTHDAQDLLKRPLERVQETGNAAVILTANEPEKLIGALTSRLRQITFKPLTVEAVSERLCYVLRAEGFAVTRVEQDLCLGIATREARGDLRRGLTYLQSAVAAGNIQGVELKRQGLVSKQP